MEAKPLLDKDAILAAVESGALNIVYERIKIPENVEVKVEGMRVKVRGPNGEIEKDFSHLPWPVYIIHLPERREIIVACNAKKTRDTKPMRTVASKIKNMIRGALEDYVCKHKVAYAHFPIRIRVIEEGGRRFILVENWYGRKDPLRIPIFGKDTKVEVITQPGSDIADEVIIRGPDKDAVTLTSGRLHDACKLRGRFRKDPRVFQDGVWRYAKGWASEVL